MDTFGAPGRVVGFAQSATKRHIAAVGDWRSCPGYRKGTRFPSRSLSEETSLSLEKSYTDVPGTTVFDADQARKGYDLNQFCMSLMNSEN